MGTRGGKDVKIVRECTPCLMNDNQMKKLRNFLTLLIFFCTGVNRNSYVYLNYFLKTSTALKADFCFKKKIVETEKGGLIILPPGKEK